MARLHKTAPNPLRAPWGIITDAVNVIRTIVTSGLGAGSCFPRAQANCMWVVSIDGGLTIVDENLYHSIPKRDA